MKINCINGFFLLNETNVGDVSKFSSLFGLGLARLKDNFTFEPLAGADDYCISGQNYLGAACSKTFSGDPSEIFFENNLVYNFNTGLVVQKASITTLVDIPQAGNWFLSSGLILPGSVTKSGDKIKSYTCHFSFDTMRFRYSEVQFYD